MSAEVRPRDLPGIGLTREEACFFATGRSVSAITGEMVWVLAEWLAAFADNDKEAMGAAAMRIATCSGVLTALSWYPLALLPPAPGN